MSRDRRPISCVFLREVSSSSPVLFSRGVTRSLTRFRTYFLVANELPKTTLSPRTMTAIAVNFIDSPWQDYLSNNRKSPNLPRVRELDGAASKRVARKGEDWSHL